MIHYLRYCCAMFFALFSFLLATPLSAQAQTREAYVSQSEDQTTLTFYYDALRSTRTGTTWEIMEYSSENKIYPAWAGTWDWADKTTTRVVFDASFRDFRPTTTATWFFRCNALKQIEGLEYLNTSEVKDMSSMFYDCQALTSIDLKHFNTKNVTDMSWMFCDCVALTSLDLKNFDTKNVTKMGSMFAGCAALTSLDLKNFDTKNVTDMSWMFYVCSALTSLDLKNFDTKKVTDMSWMFYGCAALTSIDLKNFDTKKVAKMGSMFAGCAALTSINLKNVNTKKVTDMSWMFYDCAALTSIDLKSFNTKNVADMAVMFRGCSALNSLDLQHFNTKNVTDMSLMFFDCAALTTIYCNTTWQCRASEKMFAGCTKLKGAVAYNKNKVDAKMANPKTGYFTAQPTMVERNRRRAAHLPAASKRVRGARK